ncbi:anti-sigma factor family protein [Bauldia litoralis]|uniref:anti-sigma factor family protein n=1 Tax=Bauldia litoralis TaxID=665467 RepID=UPI003265178B
MRDDIGDWERLNSFVDEELPESDAQAFERRLAADPDLKNELEGLRDLKRGLARLHPPSMEAPPAPAIGVGSTFPKRAAAIAAAIVLAVAIAAGALVFGSGPTPWLRHAETLHAEQSRRAYLVEERYVVQTVSSGHALEFRAPDLTASRLYLVNVDTSPWDDRESIAMHYRGLHGCRLTVVAIEATADAAVDGAAGDSLLRTWAHDGFMFAVIANGMDRGRFESVADYTQAAVIDSTRDNDDRMRTAMAERQRRAAPCA